MIKIFIPKYPAFFLLVFIFLIQEPVFAIALNITSPADKSQTYETKIRIAGTAPAGKLVMINQTKLVPDNEGNFIAIADLKPGKNLISVSVLDTQGVKVTKNIRILRLITYDDIENPGERGVHWAKRPIITLSTLGIIEGYPDNTFLPEDPISKGELATWIARAKNVSAGTPVRDVFYDVPKEHWRAPYIKVVVDLGIMKSSEKGRFGMDENLTRAEVIAIIAKAYNVSESLILKKGPFVDVSSGTQQANIVSSVHQKGLVVGVKENRLFEPNRPMKRAEVAILLSRFQRLKERSVLLYDFSRGFTASRYAIIDTAPFIQKLMISPNKQKPDGITPVRIDALVQDAQGNKDISQVWADLTAIGGYNNVRMNYTRGNLYELSFIVTNEAKAGNRDITVFASDKSGLKTEATVTFMVIK